MYPTSQAFSTLIVSGFGCLCAPISANGIDTVVLVICDSGTDSWRKSLSTAPLIPENGWVSFSPSALDLRSEAPHEYWIRFCGRDLSSCWYADELDGIAVKRFGQIATQTCYRYKYTLPLHKLVLLEHGSDVPDIIAKSASTTAQIPWLTRFQVMSASVLSVTTATSRMTEAMYTLLWLALCLSGDMKTSIVYIQATQQKQKNDGSFLGFWNIKFDYVWNG